MHGRVCGVQVKGPQVRLRGRVVQRVETILARTRPQFGALPRARQRHTLAISVYRDRTQAHRPRPYGYVYPRRGHLRQDRHRQHMHTRRRVHGCCPYRTNTWYPAMYTGTSVTVYHIRNRDCALATAVPGSG